MSSALSARRTSSATLFTRSFSITRARWFSTVRGEICNSNAMILFALVFVAGASLASISPVSLALQGIVTPPRDLSRSGGMYNAAYALGMLVGPPISSQLFGKWSGRAMNLHFAFIWTFFVLFTIVFRRDDPRARSA